MGKNRHGCYQICYQIPTDEGSVHRRPAAVPLVLLAGGAGTVIVPPKMGLLRKALAWISRCAPENTPESQESAAMCMITHSRFSGLIGSGQLPLAFATT